VFRRYVTSNPIEDGGTIFSKEDAVKALYIET
jgi:hypothetical protein